MKFCECKMFSPTDENDDICRNCSHDFLDHLHQVIGDCNARLDPAEMGLFP